MSEELKAAKIKGCAVSAELQLHSMIAANQRRESQGHAQAYCEFAFAEVQDDLEEKIKGILK